MQEVAPNLLTLQATCSLPRFLLATACLLAISPAAVTHSSANRVCFGQELTETDHVQLAEVRDAAREAYKQSVAGFEAGVNTAEDICLWSYRLLKTELAVGKSLPQRIEAQEAHLHRVRSLRERRIENVFQVAYYCAEAEARLADLLGPKGKSIRLKFVERQKLRGKWKVVEATLGSEVAKRPDLAFVEFSGGLVRLWYEHEGDHFCSLLFFEPDPSTTTKAVEFYGFNSPQWVRLEAIYRLDDEKLLLCWSDDHKRPSDFDKAKRGLRHVYTLVKAKPMIEASPNSE